MSINKTGLRKRAAIVTRRRSQIVIAVTVVLSVMTAWIVLAYWGALDSEARQEHKKDRRATITSFNSNAPSKEYVYAQGRLVATEEPQAQPPAYQGVHDGAGCNTIQGWAWDANNPSSTVNVDIYDGSTFIATSSANMYREDLLNALGSPNHGFSLNTPASLRNGAVHTINVKFSGTNTLLSNTGRTIQCSLAPNYSGRHDGQGCNAIEGWAWDANDPNGTVNVDIYDGAILLGTIAATLYRQDLADALGSPYHGFIFHTPASFKDGQPHTITVKYGGTNINLLDSPRTSACTSSIPNYQGRHDAADCNMISGYAWDTNDDGGTINAAIYVDGGFRVVVPAQQAYPGIGGGYHGFKYAVPASLKDGQPHSIRVKLSGTTTDLSNTPQTIVCATSAAAGTYGGFHDGTDCSVIAGGWAWDSANPDSPVSVDIFDGGTLLGRVPANQFRPDLLNAGIGNGVHGFSFPIPSSLRDGQAHSIRVKHAGTTTDLYNTPKSIVCAP